MKKRLFWLRAQEMWSIMTVRQALSGNPLDHTLVDPKAEEVESRYSADFPLFSYLPVRP